MRGELGVDRADALDRVALVVAAGEVHHVQDEGGALDVAQERVAEARALARALDESRDVGDDVAVLARLHHSEVRHERRERVVRDLRPRRGHARDQGRLAHRREPDERGVRQQLQLERDPAFLGRLAELREGRRAARRRHEVRVAAPAAAAARHDDALARVREVGDEPPGLLVAHDRAERDGKHEVLADGAVHAAALAVRAALRLEVPLELEVDERGDGRVGHQHDVAAVPAVATVGTALGHVLLAAERLAARAAVAGRHVDLGFVDEHLVASSPSMECPLRDRRPHATRRAPRPRGRGAGGSSSREICFCGRPTARAGGRAPCGPCRG